MSGLEIMAETARAEGKLALVFTVYLVIDPKAISQCDEYRDERAMAAVVRNEIASNLESVRYVHSIRVRRRRI